MAAVAFLKDAVFADEYAAQKGFLQARDPRIKVVCTGALLGLALLTKQSGFLLCLYFLCLVLACVSRIPLGFFLKRTWFFIPLFALCIALPAVFNVFSPGEPLWHFSFFGLPLAITRQGVFSAALFFMRVLVSVSLAVLLALTTRHYALLKVLRVLKVPQVFVLTLAVCYRYIYLFIETLQNTYMAMKSRVGRIVSARQGQRVVASSMAGLWQRSYQMHSEVYRAMLSRGYRGEPQILEEFRAGAKDWLWLACVAVFFVVSLWNPFLN